MQLEGLTGEQIVKKELDTGVPIIYELDSEGSLFNLLCIWLVTT
jgi:2,3-bisphosphoglycerate-dependent phosphoglycerate mutase